MDELSILPILGVYCNGILFSLANPLPTVSIEQGKFQEEVKFPWLLDNAEDVSFGGGELLPL